MPHTPIHLATKKKPLKKSDLHPYTNFDRVVLVASVLYPFSAFPQVLAVFSGRTEGVAVLSWVIFLLCASLFLLYGVRRRVMPMIVSNSIWIVMDALVIIGIFIYSSPVMWL